MSVEEEKTYETREFCGSKIRQRLVDGYLHATDMCKANGKFYANYAENNTTREYLKELSTDIGIPIDLLVEVTRSGKPNLRGTWVHPHVAIHLAQWLSPKFSVAVSKWVLRFMYGDLSLINEIKQNNEIMKLQLLEKEKLIEEKDRLLIESKSQLEHTTRGMNQINQFISNAKKRSKDQRVYILFCESDSKANIFKVGGCQSEKLLDSRLSSYNTARPSDDLYDFACIWHCSNYLDIEARIKRNIGEFLQSGKKEVYLMHYNPLFSIVDHIVEHANNETDEVNNYIRDIVEFMTKLPPITPKPYRTKHFETFEVYKEGGVEVKRERVDFSKLSADEQAELVGVYLQEYIKPGTNEVKRDDFEKHVSKSLKKYKKRELWNYVKKAAGSITGVSLSYF